MYIWKITRKIINYILNKKNAQRWVPEKIYSDDVFIVSYPRSGNTWMRFLIGNYLTGSSCSFKNVHKIIPDIHGNPGRCEEIERPRFIKSHSPYRKDYPNVIYLVRDGRDVSVSYYKYCIKNNTISENKKFDSFISSFNEGKVDPFGVWGGHVINWLKSVSDENILVVKYEDMLDDSSLELSRALSFAGIEVKDVAVDRAAEASSFENMRVSERKYHNEALGLSESDPSRRAVRKGKCGDWRNFFTEELHDRFLSVHGDALELMGYSTSSTL